VTPTFFRTPAQFRRWLEKHHAAVRELWVGFYKAGSGRGGLTYKEALDEALCFGWIDGVRRKLDDDAFVQRFTPRTAKSYWSAVNITRARQLQKVGRMHAAGTAAFERRDKATPDRYSFERAQAALDAPFEKQFRANPAAWAFFQAEAPWYRRVVTHWVTSAKKPETRQRRLDTLIADSAAGRRIASLPQKKT
jgi:uncharacterized protein YdeI (YjbR/CyaY-like superfamily)